MRADGIEARFSGGPHLAVGVALEEVEDRLLQLVRVGGRLRGRAVPACRLHGLRTADSTADSTATSPDRTTRSGRRARRRLRNNRRRGQRVDQDSPWRAGARTAPFVRCKCVCTTSMKW